MVYYIVISIVQGIGELLPISSSAHLYLLSHFAGYPEESRNQEIALHLGSLLAIMCYFYKPVGHMIFGFFKGIFTWKMESGLASSLILVCATLPSLFVGYFIKRYFDLPKTLFSIGCAFLFFGLLSFYAECFGKKANSNVTFSKAILIGVAQVFALIPGASRLGVCTTMSRLLGVSRWKGVTFSFILSIPVLAGAVALTGYDMIKDNSLHTVFHLWPAILMTFALSLAFLPALEWYLKRYTFVPFALYRLLFGGFLVYEAFKLGNGVPF